MFFVFHAATSIRAEDEPAKPAGKPLAVHPKNPH
jgi:hypothetical protein